MHLDYLIPPKLCGSRQVHPHESIASPLTRPLPWRSTVAGRATPTRQRPPYWPSERDVGSVDSGPSPPARDRLAIAILILAGANYLGERIPRSVREWAAESAFATRPIAARSGQPLASTSVPGPLAAPFAQAKIVCEDRRSFWTPQAMPIRLNAGRPMMLGPLDTWPGSVQF